MGYVKQDFKSGEKLYASQLNAMDEQIARNEAYVLDLTIEDIENIYRGNTSGSSINISLPDLLSAIHAGRGIKIPMGYSKSGTVGANCIGGEPIQIMTNNINGSAYTVSIYTTEEGTITSVDVGASVNFFESTEFGPNIEDNLGVSGIIRSSGIETTAIGVRDFENATTDYGESGQVLMADGEGGVKWESIESLGSIPEGGIDIRDIQRHLDSRMIMPARPKSQGVANAIKRAYQFTDILWTPKDEYPGVDYGPEEGRVKYMFQPNITYRGIPYEGGVIATNNYSGLIVDMDSFLSALDSPSSVLYNYDNNNDKGGGYYGTVCSKLVQYALAIPATHNTANIPNLERVKTIAAAGNYTLEDVQLGDILCYPSSHTAMVTGIYRNAFHNRNSGGEILYIEVSDAVYPVCRRRLYNEEAFTRSWIASYGLYRYELIDDVPYVENDFVKLEGDREPIKYADYALMPYEGNKRNYVQGSGTVTVHILKSGYSKAIVKRDGEIVDTITLSSTTKSFTFSKATAGHIEMYLEDINGNKSESVYAYVVKATVEVTKSSDYNQGEIEISFTGTSGVPYYVMFSQSQCCRLDGKGASYITGDGTAVVKFKVSRAQKNITIAFKNEYGIYYSAAKTFDVVEDPNEVVTLLDNSIVTRNNNMTLGSADTSLIEQEGSFVYTNVPLEANTKYSTDEGATAVWLVNKSGEGLQYYDLTENHEFTTPENTLYGYIANVTEITKVDAINAAQEWKVMDVAGSYTAGKTLSSGDYSLIANDAYFVIADIPVEANKTYYIHGAVRVWFLNSNKQKVSSTLSVATVNSFSGNPISTFVTPANTAYVSVSFMYTKSDKALLYMREIGECDPDIPTTPEGPSIPALPDEPTFVTNYLETEGVIVNENMTLTETDSTLVAADGETVYTNVPVEANTTYRVDAGTTRVWITGKGSGDLMTVVPSEDNGYQFTTPSVADKVFLASVANGTMLQKLVANDATNDYNAVAVGSAILANQSLGATAAAAPAAKDGYYTIRYIPVDGAGTYYCRGAVRATCYNRSQIGISTVNSYTGVDTMFVFDAPSGTEYIGITSMYSWGAPELLFLRKLQ